jgi:ribosome-associated protein
VQAAASNRGAGSPSLADPVRRARLERFAGSRLTKDGVLVIDRRSGHRTQERKYLGEDGAGPVSSSLIRRAAVPADRPRRPTKPTKASRARRLEPRSAASGIKGLRQAKPPNPLTAPPPSPPPMD